MPQQRLRSNLDPLIDAANTHTRRRRRTMAQCQCGNCDFKRGDRAWAAGSMVAWRAAAGATTQRDTQRAPMLCNDLATCRSLQAHGPIDITPSASCLSRSCYLVPLERRCCGPGESARRKLASSPSPSPPPSPPSLSTTPSLGASYVVRSPSSSLNCLGVGGVGGVGAGAWRASLGVGAWMRGVRVGNVGTSTQYSTFSAPRGWLVLAVSACMNH